MKKIFIVIIALVHSYVYAANFPQVVITPRVIKYSRELNKTGFVKLQILNQVADVTLTKKFMTLKQREDGFLEEKKMTPEELRVLSRYVDINKIWDQKEKML